MPTERRDTECQESRINITPGYRTRMTQFLHHVQLSRIQTEIHQVKFFDQRLPEDTVDYEHWLQNMESAIQAWQEGSTCDHGAPEWYVSAANHSRVLLHRPCPRNIVPPDTSLQAASAAAIRMINCYWSLVQAGNMFSPFQHTYSGFQAGMVLMYALRNHGRTLRESSLEDEVHKALDLLVKLFVSVETLYSLSYCQFLT